MSFYVCDIGKEDEYVGQKLLSKTDILVENYLNDFMFCFYVYLHMIQLMTGMIYYLIYTY